MFSCILVSFWQVIQYIICIIQTWGCFNVWFSPFQRKLTEADKFEVSPLPIGQIRQLQYLGHILFQLVSVAQWWACQVCKTSVTVIPWSFITYPLHHYIHVLRTWDFSQKHLCSFLCYTVHFSFFQLQIAGTLDWEKETGVCFENVKGRNRKRYYYTEFWITCINKWLINYISFSLFLFFFFSVKEAFKRLNKPQKTAILKVQFGWIFFYKQNIKLDIKSK